MYAHGYRIEMCDGRQDAELPATREAAPLQAISDSRVASRALAPRPGRALDVHAEDSEAADCNILITPACLKDLYKTTGYKVNVASNNTLGIAGYLENYANINDLEVQAH